MFSFKNKLHEELKRSMDKRTLKTFRVLIKYKDLEKNIMSKIISYKGTVYSSIDSLKIISASLTAHSIERLIEYPEVQYISLDNFCFLCGKRHELRGINLRSANRTYLNPKYGITGAGIGIGIIDTGVYPHSDLINPNRINLFFDIINKFNYPYDDSGHGSCISGIICGSGISSKDSIFKGVAPQSHLCVYKAFGSNGRGYVSDVLYSLSKLIEDSESYNIRVLCLPFELLITNTFIDDLFEKLFDMAQEKNIIPVVPAGSNESTEGTLMGIASCKNVITVGGINTFNGGYQRYKYSSAGPVQKVDKPDISAACTNIISLNTVKTFIPERNGIKLYPPHLEEPYAVYSGTSTACAFISGVCALILENNPKLAFKDVNSLLKVCSRDINLPKEIQGAGLPDLNMIFS
ncbi:Subtilase family protein [Clostridium cadaveris]|uniref:Subtilase family protein n=1 Tax=Clostridium cadaveris TaxID=1529 RepID=A0A1I2MD44_9CLOT|nr:S8 family serine peptidase [Clostridium cadaveris]MDM8313082.1 S8 family serine peptidase [Clostridium cadaveris]NWK10138.1 S8 family serine peptidase [Clostridium cadaveris]SFF87131.1 Subtilase family protein [Clostridium cadaveris]